MQLIYSRPVQNIFLWAWQDSANLESGQTMLYMYYILPCSLLLPFFSSKSTIQQATGYVTVILV